jgi:chromate reductase, NAD(P)H dehydrogenase (quinone)
MKGCTVRMTKIGMLVGSLRKESLSRKLAASVKQFFPEGYQAEFIEIGKLPLYNQDLDDENNVPEEYTVFRNKIKEMDGILFVTPEYNRSIPAVLKNALDVASRPYGDSAWNGKPAAIISQSPGGLGGFGANHHLRQVLTCLNMPIVQQPEVYLGNIQNVMDDHGNLKNEGTVKFLQSLIDTFVDLIRRYQA